MRICLAIVALILSVSIAYAKSNLAEPKDYASALQEEGYAAKLSKSSSGDPIIESSSQGAKWKIFFLNCEDHQNCGTMQFFSGFDSDKVSFSMVNDWNKGKRFAKAYLNKDGAAIECDIILDGGMSTALFKSYFGLWDGLVGDFVKAIGWGK